VDVEATTSSAMQTREPNAVPSSSIALVKLNDAIQFFGGSSMNTPT
jgi:hypothetical protein